MCWLIGTPKFTSVPVCSLKMGWFQANITRVYGEYNYYGERWSRLNQHDEKGDRQNFVSTMNFIRVTMKHLTSTLW